jgi:phosphoribosylformimino-5-aminoimidazole carboxamide ribotide isomerase
MIAIPTVELRNGLCVRSSGTNDGDGVISVIDGVGVARGWAHAGFHRIHLVDVDAEAGSGFNDSLVDEIIRDGAIEVQTHCAAQSTDDIERMVAAGAVRVVVGPRALEEPDWLAGAAELYPGLLVVVTDVRERRVVTRGWVRSLPLDILDVVEELNGFQLGGLLVSAATSDGARSNADLALLEDVAEACDFAVIAAGGVSTMNHLRALEHRGVSAVLLGEPLCNGQLDPHAVAMQFGE